MTIFKSLKTSVPSIFQQPLSTHTEKESAPPIRSNFEKGTENWQVVDLLTSANPSGPDYKNVLAQQSVTWFPADGGFIGAKDVTTQAFFFDAPRDFLGDKSAYYGGALKFSMKSDTNNFLGDNVVALVGRNGTVLVAEIPGRPEKEWSDFQIPLDTEKTCFRLGSKNGDIASEETVRSVLGDLEALRISGEWGDPVVETTSLDNVELLPAPDCASVTIKLDSK